ncbi:hypothetical protein FRUB_09246 [Fimbriiglobus ruber]|uniref:Uncharacterized protein n=1 Tax=Fimbriiglobus ruber TaxID=1908690 RepID=A0A225D6S2_9BACT|nr:hypothetical protein FRUB_09246 [Fimbriiglobus ruber]
MCRAGRLRHRCRGWFLWCAGRQGGRRHDSIVSAVSRFGRIQKPAAMFFGGRLDIDRRIVLPRNAQQENDPARAIRRGAA